MRKQLLIWAWLCLGFWGATIQAADDFQALSNGKDLTGWVNVNCAPETWSVSEGLIVCTGKPTGVLRTERQYENFVVELEWKHIHPLGNAGFFVHSGDLPIRGQPFTKAIEVQVLDGRNSEVYTSHGDVFAIQGATMKPDRPHPKGAMLLPASEFRCNPAGQWNHYRVVCVDGTIKLSVNGKEVSGGSECNPRKGYLCLESEGSEVHFRNLKIKELPSSNPPPELVAQTDQGFQSLYTGLDLRGWKADEGHTGHWKPLDWRLAYDGQSQAADKNLWSEKEYGDFVLIADWRLTAKPQKKQVPVVLANGDYALDDAGQRKMQEIDDAGDSGIYLRGNSKSQVNIWCWPIGSGEVYGYRNDATQPAEVRAAVTPKLRADLPPGQWNRFIITLQGDRLTVNLNGQTVIDRAQLPGIPARGPIALQHHGDTIEFANLYIKELPK